MASRRSLATTTAAAAGVLLALSFVPSASATTVADSAQDTAVAAAAPAVRSGGHDLADTGAVDTTPYLVGGTGFLGVGAALLLAARRRALALDAKADDPSVGV